jgi:hypothetical protein
MSDKKIFYIRYLLIRTLMRFRKNVAWNTQCNIEALHGIGLRFFLPLPNPFLVGSGKKRSYELFSWSRPPRHPFNLFTKIAYIPWFSRNSRKRGPTLEMRRIMNHLSFFAELREEIIMVYSITTRFYI